MYLIPVVVSLGVLLVFGHASPPPANDSCQAKMTAFPLEDGSRCCTHLANSKLINGNKTEIDQDPWVALIDYDIKKGSGKRLCSGTLISGKYVLTAAHCVLGPVENIATPTKVRLGEYNLNNEGPDCVTVEQGSSDCTDGAITIDIEMIIPHPKYDPKSTSKANDIALIRLKEAAPYTDFIRPICLPTTNPETNPPDYPMHAISWNKDNEKIIYSIPFVNQEKCKLIYTKPRFNVGLGQGQLCAGGLEGQDPCRGDGGGPLVYDTKEGRAELAGIVSFGPVPCGQKDIPSIYTNIYEYLDWIKSVIVE